MTPAKRCLGATAALIALAGCGGSSNTGLLVLVEPAAGTIAGVNRLDVTLNVAGAEASLRVPEPPAGDFTLGSRSFTLQIDDGSQGDAILRVDAVAGNGTPLGTGMWSGPVRRGKFVVAHVALTRFEPPAEPPPENPPEPPPPEPPPLEPPPEKPPEPLPEPAIEMPEPPVEAEPPAEPPTEVVDAAPDGGAEPAVDAPDAPDAGGDGSPDAPIDSPVAGDGGSETCVAAQIALGDYHTCARKADGTLWCWGGNGKGQLGDGTTMGRTGPVQVGALGASVAEVAAGYQQTCARKTDGTLWCWGYNFWGQLGDGTTTSSSTPVQIAALGTSVASVAAGHSHTCARKTDGTLWCWGYNFNGQLGDGTTTSSSTPVQAIALGTSTSDVAAGDAYTCARKIDGTLWCWGKNLDGQLGDGTTTERKSPVQVGALGLSVAEVAVAYSHTCARRTDGTLWCWGGNSDGELGDGTNTPRTGPVMVTVLGAAVVEVAAAGHLDEGFMSWSHTCARRAGGTLWCWGSNGDGEIGDGTTMNRASPVQVTALGMSASEVAAGPRHTCARRTDGTLSCWGRNGWGQLGDGTYTDRSTPAAVKLCP